MKFLGSSLIVAICLTSTGAGCRHTAPVLSDWEQAEQLAHRGDFAAALPILERLRAERPDDFDVARAYVEAAARTHALPRVIEVEAARPPSATGKYALGLAEFARAQEMTPQADKHFRDALALHPRAAEIPHRFGLALVESEHYVDAVQVLETARALAPQSTAVLLLLSKAAAKAGRREQAIETLQALLEASPTGTQIAVARQIADGLSANPGLLPRDARERLAEGLKWLHDFDVPQQAMVTFEQVIRDYPDLAEAHALLGLARQKVDDVSGAIEAYRRAIELDPLDARPRLYLGEIYASRERPKAAQETLKAAVAIHPLLADAYLRLGELALARRDLDEAGWAWSKLAVVHPTGTLAHERLAKVHLLKKNFAEAERELLWVLARAPGHLDSMLQLGLLHSERLPHLSRPEERRHAQEQARHWLKKVLESQPDNALAARTLSAVGAP